MINLLARVVDSNLCGGDLAYLYVIESDWEHNSVLTKGEVMVRVGYLKKSLDLPWVKSPEASGNTGDQSHFKLMQWN